MSPEADTKTQSSHAASTKSGSAAGSAQIQRDIDSLRARMNQTLADIEHRLAPQQLASEAMAVVGDMLRGHPNRIADTIRRNPIPVALIGIGAVWLAVAASRSSSKSTALARPARASELVEVLQDIVRASRQGSEHLRQAAEYADEGLRDLFVEAAEMHDRHASALATEIQRLSGRRPQVPEDVSASPDRPHPAWTGLRRGLATRDRQSVQAGVESGEDQLYRAFRRALHDPLPSSLRVMVGAQFHDVEGLRNRLAARLEVVSPG